MKRSGWVIIIFIVLLFSSLFAEWDEFGVLTDEEKLFGLSLIWKEVDYNYPHFRQLPDLDWDAEYRNYIPKVLDTENIYEYYLVLQRFAALLQDCHTRVIFPQGFTALLDYPLVHLKRIEDKIIVSNVGIRYEESLPIGSEILEVDGIQVDKYLEEEVIPYISASNPAVLDIRAMSMLLFGLKESEVKVRFRYPDRVESGGIIEGEIDEATLVRDSTYDRWSGLIDSKEELLYHRWLDDEILYVALYSFNDELIITMFESIIPELKRSKGVIIDLRENRWGRREVSDEILKFLTTQDVLTGITTKTRKHIALYKAWGTPIQLYSYLPPEEYIPYGIGDVWHSEDPVKIRNDAERDKIMVPLAILIGNETAFAAEDFLVALKSSSAEMTLIGSHTAGTRGQALILRLPGMGYVFVSTQRDTYGEDKILTRFGIRPDEKSEMRYEDYLRDKDPVLDKGYEILRQNLDTGSGEKSD